MEERFSQHMRYSGNNSAKHARIRDIRSAGYMVLIITIEQCEEENEARLLEAYHITRYGQMGIFLCNNLLPEHKKRAKKVTHNTYNGHHAGKLVLAHLYKMASQADTMRKQHTSQTDILKLLFDVKPGDNRDYKTAKRIFNEILSK